MNDLDKLDRGLLLSLTGAEVNPFEKRHWNLTRQLMVADQAPDFATQLKFMADHPELTRPTTKLGRPT